MSACGRRPSACWLASAAVAVSDARRKCWSPVDACATACAPAIPRCWPPPRLGAPSHRNPCGRAIGYHSGDRAAARDHGRGRRAARPRRADRGRQRFAAYPFVGGRLGRRGHSIARCPTLLRSTASLALRALFRPRQCVGGSRGRHWPDPRARRSPTPTSSAIDLSDERLRASARPARRELRPQRFGHAGRPRSGTVWTEPVLPRRQAFHVFNVCNHWVARLLSAAGVPTAPVPATLPQGLLLDLKWRAGLTPLPAH